MEPTEPKTESPPKRKRRWFQYSLRTLLVIVLLASIGMSWFAVRMQQARRQKEAVEAINRLDGQAIYDYQQSGTREPPGPAWLRNVLGQDFFTTVLGVSFSSPFSSPSVSDADLEHLKALTKLQVLDLMETPVSDAGLEHLKGLTQLRELDLRGTKVTGDGVKKLRQALPNCKIDWTPPTKDQRQGPAAPDQLR